MSYARCVIRHILVQRHTEQQRIAHIQSVHFVCQDTLRSETNAYAEIGYET